MKRFCTTTLLILCTSTALASDTNNCAASSSSYWPRSQGRDKTRQVVGSVGKTHLYEQDSWYYMFSALFEYTRSFKPERIAQCLFGPSLIDNCDCPTINVQGSAVADRDAKAWLADYFYLPTDFSSTLQFRPRIENFVGDLDLYIGLDEWHEGVYFRIYGPITHTRWDLNFCESCVETGTQAHSAGYFTPKEISRDKLLDSFTSYACGNAPAPTDPFTFANDPIGDFDWADIDLNSVIFQPLKYAKIDKCKRTKTGFADLRMELGWNVVQHEDYHLGFNVQAAAPTGSKQKACFVFDPLVGNGNHWEAGGGVTGHWVFWRSEEEEKHAGFYFDANITHMIKARHMRTFDLCEKPNSRYMLATKMSRVILNNLTGALNPDQSTNDLAVTQAQSPSARFAYEYAPVANLSTLETKVSVGIQADVVALFNYTCNAWSFDFGYNFWGRSCEKIRCPECNTLCCPTICDLDQENSWALKGDARMFGFGAGFQTLTKGFPIALSASQSKATICKGTNASATGGTDPKKQNFGVDNATFSYANNPGFYLPKSTFITFDGENPLNKHIKTSVDPIFIKCSDLNFQATRGISHKVFAHLQYTWERDSDWIPFLGVGGFGEFGKTESKCCCNNNSCSSCSATTSDPCATSCNPCGTNCVDCALSQWGVWIKGGVFFS